VETTQARAQAGDATAMLLMALVHLQGRGVPADESKSLDWLRKAADAGEPHAALYYARALIGTGRAERDYSIALRYAEKAQASIPEAGLEVGLILSSGRPGVAPDPFRGAVAFERAARAGSPTSQYLYALCLQTGTGVARDAAAAIPWLQKASEQGLPMARLRLGQAWYFGDGVPKDYGRALALLEQAAEASEPGAFNTLGLYYSDGVAISPDFACAAQYFRRGAEQGDVHAQLNYGSALLMGHGVPVNEREAARWLTLAADAGNVTAQYLVGLLSLSGSGVPVDVTAGVRRVQQSASGGFPLAFDELCDLSIRERSGIRMDAAEFTPTLQAGTARNQPACLYIQAVRLNGGILGPRDAVQAVELLKRAAEGGYHQAELDYGRQFLAMVGQVDASYEAELLANARHWLTRAAEHGSKQAEQLLAQQGWR
jgi:TPR repeat protein